MGASLVPLHWYPGARCEFRGQICDVLEVRANDVTIRLPRGGRMIVARYAIELPPLPPSIADEVGS